MGRERARCAGILWPLITIT